MYAITMMRLAYPLVGKSRSFFVLKRYIYNVKGLGFAHPSFVDMTNNEIKNCQRWHSTRKVTFHIVCSPPFYRPIVFFYSNARSTCWKCSKALSPLSKFFCEHCATILSPTDIDYFGVLDVEKTFEVSLSALQTSFKESQKLFHPDKFTLKSEGERKLSEEVSSLINAAYFTLIDPLRRGIYMLKLEGLTINENTQMDNPEFLMEVMELNEEIAEAEDSETLVKIQTRIKEESSTLIADLANAFKSAHLEQAKDLLIKLRYFNNMSEKLRHSIPPS